MFLKGVEILVSFVLLGWGVVLEVFVIVIARYRRRFRFCWFTLLFLVLSSFLGWLAVA